VDVGGSGAFFTLMVGFNPGFAGWLLGFVLYFFVGERGEWRERGLDDGAEDIGHGLVRMAGDGVAVDFGGAAGGEDLAAFLGGIDGFGNVELHDIGGAPDGGETPFGVDHFADTAVLIEVDGVVLFEARPEEIGELFGFFRI